MTVSTKTLCAGFLFFLIKKLDVHRIMPPRITQYSPLLFPGSSGFLIYNINIMIEMLHLV